MKLIRGQAKLKKLSNQEGGFVNAPPAERVSFIWELTAELWSLKEQGSAERRLQRDVTNLIKQ